MLSDFFSSEAEYRKAFDHFEYLAALVFADYYEKEHPTYGTVWVPLGRFAESYRTLYPGVQAEIQRQGDQWPLLKSGVFDGSLDRLLMLKEKVDTWTREVAVNHGFW